MDELPAAAREVADRVASGAPAGIWTVPETTLAMLLSVYVDPSKLGGKKLRADGSERQHPAVVAVARAVGRTADAVVMKVMNLRSKRTEGARGLPHAASLERVVLDRYAAHFDQLLFDAVAMSRHIPGAAEAINAIVSPAIAAGADRADTVLDVGPEPETTRIAEVALRKGQDVFRGRVLSNYAHTCAFCGLRSRMPDENSYLLVASHIRPWKDSSGHERLDPANGFSLCGIHDRAFEWGFLTVDERLRIVASHHARDHYAPEERVHAEILSLDGTDLVRPGRHFLAPAEPYLTHHREKVFERRFRKGA